MSEQTTCPGCGAGVREEHFSDRRFECMTLELDELGLIGAELRESADCLRRQLAQRDERNAALEARALRMERALRTIEAWPFNIMGDCVADARALARKALEE